MGQVMDYGRFVPGGKLEIMDLRSGKIDNILEDYLTADVSSVDLSFDATKVLFTMKKDGSDYYHVYWAGLTRGDDGKFPITQLTFQPFDDQQAIWAAGDRIVFTTNQAYTDMGTRADEYNHGRVVTQLASVTLSGGDADRKLCSQNLSHVVTLFSMSDGRVGFSRWEHLENVNDVKLMAMNPDCTQMIGLNGQFGKPGNSLVQFTESQTPYVFYGVVTNRENTIQAGSLVKLDARWVEDESKLDMEKTSAEAYSMLTPQVPTGVGPIGRTWSSDPGERVGRDTRRGQRLVDQDDLGAGPRALVGHRGADHPRPHHHDPRHDRQACHVGTPFGGLVLFGERRRRRPTA
jgi:hypothetical protein